MRRKMYSPLEQFKVFSIYNINISHYFSLSNFTLYMFFIFSLFVIFFIWPIWKGKIIPNIMQLCAEDIYNFLLTIARQQLSNIAAFRFFPVFGIVFIFILISNFLGLTPLAFTVTSHIYITFLLAFSLFLGITILGFYYNRLTFVRFFLPSGIPTFLIPFLVVIEVISYIIRPFSLSIRLFANMLAGHTLLFILSGFAIKLSVIAWLGVIYIPFVFVFLIMLLEIAIAFIQAYVFCVLLFIYLNDIYKLILKH